MTLEENKTDRRMGRGMKILLAVSLALNLAVVGIVAGAVLRDGGGRDSAKRSPGLGAFGTPYIRALPKEDRRAIVDALRSARKDDMTGRAERRALYEEVLDQLRQSPFDPEALEAAVTRQSGVAIDVRTAAQTAWIEVVTNMTDAERTEYATAVQDALRKGPKR